jgi:Ankyrin repeats (3 copies)
MKNNQEKSQSLSKSGAGTLFISIFALIWDTIVFRFLVPQSDVPFWFKTVFVVAGFIVTVAAAFAWRQRILGGSAKLHLSADPVPHGVKVSANFELAKKIHAQAWTLEATLEHERKNDENFRTLWSQTFPARALDAHHVHADFVFPNDYSPHKLNETGTTYRRTLILKADYLRWDFLLQVRDASSGEMAFAPQDAAHIGNNLPVYSPADIEKWKGRTGIIKVIAFTIFAIFFVSPILSFFDIDLWSRAKAKVGAGAYSTQVSTDEFDVRVTNYLMNNWAFRGRLVGKGRVTNGELRVRVEGLDIQATNECKGDAKKCEVSQVRLLLSNEGGTSFSTPAQSAPLDVNAQLQDVTRWSLPPEHMGTELVMQLPPSIDVDSMRLKLEIRTAANSTVYPDGGPYLTLHRALAKANGQRDPCEKITSKLMLVQAGCDQQLQALHSKPLGLLTSISASNQQAWLSTRQYASKLGFGTMPKADEETLDNLLLEAIQSENFVTAQALLKMGASPNAEDSYQVGRTALGYAAATKNVDLVNRLLQAGAKADERKLNDRGQIVTPLTQALRVDASNTIEHLIKAGASIHTNDPTGWTPMHIAAYESSKLSIEALVKAGANVNERTPAYRQQNVLQTALQFGDAETISTLLKLGADPLFKDSQAKNACDWALFFKRNDKIQALVCRPA